MSETTSNGEVITEKMKVTVKQLDGETFSLELMKDASVLGLKTMIFQVRNITIDRQRLIYHAQELRDNEALLSQYGIVNDSVIHIVIRPVGNADLPPVNNNVVVNIPIPQQDDEGHIIENVNAVPRHLIPQNVDVFKIVRLCRFIKIMSITNAIFLCVFGMQLYPLFVLSLLSIAGYIGAKYLKRPFLGIYMICLILDICFRIFVLYILLKFVYFVLFFSLMVIIDIFLFKMTLQLYRIIPLLPDDVKQQIIHFNRLGFF